MFAPIALFAYRRPAHLARTIDALLSNPEARHTPLFVFSDAPKDAEAAPGVDEVRCLLRGLQGFAEIRLVCREHNFGLARNITGGVSSVLAHSERVIVVEDDILVSPHFLRFMNDALALYRDAPRVGSISGFFYPTDQILPETFFVRGADCWGWATWRDRWQVYNPDGRALLAQLRAQNLVHQFDLDGAMGFTRMLEEQIAQKNDSWAVRWHASCYLRNLLTLYPARSLVANIGNDGSGTHVKAHTNAFDVHLSPTPVCVGNIPIVESHDSRSAICAFFRKSQAGESRLGKTARQLARWLGLRRLTRRL